MRMNIKKQTINKRILYGIATIKDIICYAVGCLILCGYEIIKKKRIAHIEKENKRNERNKTYG